MIGGEVRFYDGYQRRILYPTLVTKMMRTNSYAEKDEPQPQVVVALGLRITNWAPEISSL